MQYELADDEMWGVQITNPHSFKSLCDIVANVLIHTHFHLVQGPTFVGLKVDSIDPSMTCMVKARFACEVLRAEDVDSTDMNFCVRMRTLNTLLKHVTSQHVLRIVRCTGSPNLVMRACDKNDLTISIEFNLNTLDEPIRTVGLNNIDTRYTVEIDLGMFKSICKMCKDIKSTIIGFRITATTAAGGEKKDVFFTVRSQGDEAGVSYTFASPPPKRGSVGMGVGVGKGIGGGGSGHGSGSGDGSGSGEQPMYIRPQKRLRASQTRRDAEQLLYDEIFPTEYLNLFMKSMERQMITRGFRCTL